MLRLFLGNQILSLLLLPFLVGAYSISNYFSNYFEVMPSIDLGFWGRYSFYQVDWIYYITGTLVVSNAIGINYLFNNNEFYDRNSYAPSLFYCVFLSFFHTYYQLDGVLLSHSFVILGLLQLFHLHNNKDGRKASFNAGFLFGVAATFQPMLLILLPLLWVMITRIRPFIIRELVLSLNGFITPLLYLATYLSVVGDITFWSFDKIPPTIYHKNMLFMISMIIFLVIGILSLLALRSKSSKSSIRFKKLIAILKITMYLGVALGLFEYLYFSNYEWFSYSIITLCFLLPFSFFNSSSKLLAKMLFYGVFLLSFSKFFLN